MQGWELLKRLLSGSAREGGEEGGVETPDTSLVRRNQLENGGRRKPRPIKRQQVGGVETPDTSLVSGNQMKRGKGLRQTGKGEEE